MGFKLSDLSDFKKLENVAKTQRNRRNKARRKERKREWKANNPKPERKAVPEVKQEETQEPKSVNDVLKAVSDNRKKAKR